MKFLDLYKKIRKKTTIRQNQTPKTTVPETFEKIFLGIFENFEKIGWSTTHLYLSNIIKRTFSYILYPTLDGKNAGFFKEKTAGDITTLQTQPGGTKFFLDNNLVRRTKRIGISVYNQSQLVTCGVHIRVQGPFIQSPINEVNLFYFTVAPVTLKTFEFDIASFDVYLIFEAVGPTGESIIFKTYYLPI